MTTVVDVVPQTPGAETPSTRRTTPPERGVLAPLARRRFLELGAAEVVPPKMRVVEFRLNRIKAAGRLFVWLLMFATFAGGVAWDWLRLRSSPARSAFRLRRTFERAGGTFIKLGRALGMRLDLLPWHYGAELFRMRDIVPPFAVAKAIAAIERATRRPLADTFATFDPKPIASSTVSCVYQAFLGDGRKVVVKVRRPGIGELLMADLKVFDWLAGALEFLTVLRPGRTATMRSDLRDALLSELDFVHTARQQDWFRRAAKKSGKRFFTAPRVHFELSNEEVLTQQFVDGMWLWELLGAIEHDNDEALATARRLKIDRRQVARRLAWVNHWGWHEHLFFRADPHPDGVIIGEGGKLTFIDFGSGDAINRTKRRALQQNMYHASKRDALNMARASLVLLEPLPQVDVLTLTRELEAHNWEMLHAFESRPSRKEWSQRTFARQWIGVFQAARRHHITIDFSILRLLRVNVLYDALVVRLDPEMDVIKAYRRFARYQTWRTEARGYRRLFRRATGGADNTVYLRLERLAGTAEGVMFRFRQMLVAPRANFTGLMSKWAFAAYTVIAIAAQLFALTALGSLVFAAPGYVGTAQMTTAGDAVRHVVALRSYQWLAVAVVLVNGRKLLFRMQDKES